MKTTVTHGYTRNGRPNTTVQAGDVYNDVLYTASVDAKGGLANAKERAIALVLEAIERARENEHA